MLTQEGRRYRVRLRKLIITHFSKDDIRTLCFDLGLNYDDLPDTGLSNITRELIVHLGRRDRIVELIELCARERPNFQVEWEELKAAFQANPKLFEPTLSKVEKRPKYDVSESISALASLMQVPNVRTSVLSFHKDFETARTKINLINHYKSLHDKLQEIETAYYLVASDRESLPGDESAWDSLIINVLPLQESLFSFQDLFVTAVEQPPLWATWLEKGQEGIDTAVIERDLRSLDRTLQYLYRGLDQGLPRVNARLVLAAADMPLDDLVTAMTAVHQTSMSQSELEVDTINAFARGVDTLAALADDLSDLVIYHDTWQGLDDELRRIQANLVEDIVELEVTWPDLKEMTTVLYGQSEERWALSLKTIATYLEEAMNNKPYPIIIGIFRSFRSQASRHFRRVDTDLLQLCRELQKVGEPLDLLLSTIR